MICKINIQVYKQKILPAKIENAIPFLFSPIFTSQFSRSPNSPAWVRSSIGGITSSSRPCNLVSEPLRAAHLGWCTPCQFSTGYGQEQGIVMVLFQSSSIYQREGELRRVLGDMPALCAESFLALCGEGFSALCANRILAFHGQKYFVSLW